MIEAIYIDSCIVIHAVERAASQGAFIAAQVDALLDRADFFISDLVRLECRVRPLRDGLADVVKQYDAFFELVSNLSVTGEVFDLATELRAHQGLKTADAIHAATAMYYDCTEFWTNDSRFDRIANQIRVRQFHATP
jgi:predicted nucleic acid-binding protein